MASVDLVSPQVRRIAILVTSLDTTAGRQLLMAMPQQLARDVRKAIANMTSVSPEEQRQVLAEFRMQALTANGPSATHAPHNPRTPSHSAVTPDRSLDRRDHENYTVEKQSESRDQTSVEAELPQQKERKSASWQQLELETLIEMLSGERATVIAVVLSQLHPEQAAGLLGGLPREQHRSALVALTHLGKIDPEAMQAIDEHLAGRIADYHHRRSTEDESVGRMQELLAVASPELRSQWQEIIAESDQQLAERMGIPRVRREPSQSPHVPRATKDVSVENPYDRSIVSMASGVITTADHQVASTIQISVPDSKTLENETPHVIPFPGQVRNGVKRSRGTSSVDSARNALANTISALDQILDLAPTTIGRILASADGQVVLLALAGATPQFMQRFNGMLEKQDAKVLNSRLRQLGAINLQDVDEAQRRLCRLASRVVADMQNEHDAALAARAVA